VSREKSVIHDVKEGK